MADKTFYIAAKIVWPETDDPFKIVIETDPDGLRLPEHVIEDVVAEIQYALRMDGPIIVIEGGNVKKA